MLMHKRMVLSVLGALVGLMLAVAACVPSTPFVLTAVSVSTAIEVGTALPVTISVGGGSPAPFQTPELPTLIPPLPSGLSPTELKYRLLVKFPNLFYCDPDYYPVARADVTELARQRFPELQSNQEEFQAILNHNGLSGLTDFTDDQKLLIYQEHKKLASIIFTVSGNGYQFQLRIAQNNKQGFVVKGTIDAGGSINIQEQQPTIAMCPICLAVHTRIDTPNGSAPVEDLHVGDAVWTVNGVGERIATVILKVVRVPVPAGHQVMHIVLSDGRQLWASPGHPTTDGRVLGDLESGDLLDGARIVQAQLVPYDQTATYDVLPSGGTGFYWANGILIGSTLTDH